MVLVQNVGAELHAMEADIKFSQTIDIGGGGVRTIYTYIYIYIYIYRRIAQHGTASVELAQARPNYQL